MKKSKRLQPVLHLAERNCRQAEQALGQAQQRLMSEQSKLQQLHDYLGEYQAGVRSRQKQGIQAQELIRLQEFMSRLQAAIDQQAQQIALAEQMLEQAKLQWQAAHGRHRAMETLIEKSVVQERQEEDKRLQKSIDEMIQNRRSNSSSDH